MLSANGGLGNCLQLRENDDGEGAVAAAFRRGHGLHAAATRGGSLGVPHAAGYYHLPLPQPVCPAKHSHPAEWRPGLFLGEWTANAVWRTGISGFLPVYPAGRGPILLRIIQVVRTPNLGPERCGYCARGGPVLGMFRNCQRSHGAPTRPARHSFVSHPYLHQTVECHAPLV